MTAPTATDPTSARERLIAAAFRVVARDGLDGASVKAVATEAEVAPGLVHYHFPSRDALLAAALERSLELYVAESRRRREGTPPEGQLDALFAFARASEQREEDFFRVRLAFAARAMTDAETARLLAPLNRAAVEETARTFAAAQGREAPTPAEIALAAGVKAAFDGLMLARLTDPAFPTAAAGALIEAGLRARFADLLANPDASA